MEFSEKYKDLRETYERLSLKIIDLLKNNAQGKFVMNDTAPRLKDYLVQEALKSDEFNDFYDSLWNIVEPSIDHRALFVVIDSLERKAIAEIAYDRITDNLSEDEVMNGHLVMDKPGYSQLIKSIEEFPNHERVYTFLYAVECEITPIILGGKYRIRSANLFEIAKATQEPRFSGIFPVPQYIIETMPNEEIGTLDGDLKFQGNTADLRLSIQYKPKQDIESLIALCRVVEPSAIGIQVINYIFLPEGMMIPMQIITRTELFPPFFGKIQTNMTFTDDSLKKLEALWTNFQSIRKKERLNRSIRRYNTALCSDDEEDQLVDLIISLETLFQAMGFKVAFLSSFLLGLEEGERAKSLELLERAYRIRNGIVHGGSIKKKDIPLVNQLLFLVAKILGFAIMMRVSGSALNDRIRRAYLDDIESKKLESDVREWLTRI